jgi:hypothetical protein
LFDLLLLLRSPVDVAWTSLPVMSLLFQTSKARRCLLPLLTDSLFISSPWKFLGTRILEVCKRSWFVHSASFLQRSFRVASWKAPWVLACASSCKIRLASMELEKRHICSWTASKASDFLLS